MRRAGARALASLAVVILLFSASAWADATPAAASRTTGPALTMTVVDVNPNSPSVSTKPKNLTFTLQLVNHTPYPMTVAVSVSRSDPIATTEGLDSAVAHPKPPSDQYVVPLTAHATAHLSGDGNPGAAQPVTLHTITSTDYNTAVNHHGLCLCANLIYPFWFIGSYTGTDDNGNRVSGEATAQTFLPSFETKPVKNTVSWVWPIFDRPHRLLESGTFFDDALATEIKPGHRLDNLLEVLRQLPNDIPITIMTDPELIAELAQMEQGYQVSTPNGPKPGTGSAAAGKWLAKLRLILTEHEGGDTIEFTPFADPAVDSLTRAGMSWPASLDAHDQTLVTTALGGGRTPPSNIAWPVGRSLSPKTLAALAKQGANTVIVSDTSLSKGDVSPVPNALAKLPAGTSEVTAAVTSAPIEQLVNETLDPSVDGLATLPLLVSELAVRKVEDITAKIHDSKYIVITPQRLLDVNVDTALRTIEATASSTWSVPMTLEQAAGTITQSQLGDFGTLRSSARGLGLPRRLLRRLNHVTNEVPQVQSLFHDEAVGVQLFANFPAAIQRCESTSLISDPSVAFRMAGRLQQVLSRTRHAVYIVAPSVGTYTLTSKNSQLPITVVNKLNADVDVKISVQPVDGESGLTAQSSGPDITIKANSKEQVKIPTHVDRVGLIKVDVTITTPGGLPLGTTIHLSVRSTALGTIGVVITVLAGILLVVAVVIRQVRRLRNRTRRERREPTPVAATTASQA